MHEIHISDTDELISGQPILYMVLWIGMRSSLYVDYIDVDLEECMVSTDKVNVKMGDNDGYAYLRTFGDTRYVAFSFDNQEQEVWVNIDTYKIHYPSTWDFDFDFKITWEK